MASFTTVVHDWILKLWPQEAPMAIALEHRFHNGSLEYGPLQLSVLRIPRDAWIVSLRQTCSSNRCSQFGYLGSVWHPPPPLDQTHHQEFTHLYTVTDQMTLTIKLISDLWRKWCEGRVSVWWGRGTWNCEKKWRKSLGTIDRQMLFHPQALVFNQNPSLQQTFCCGSHFFDDVLVLWILPLNR